jgi:hypothetical protein
MWSRTCKLSLPTCVKHIDVNNPHTRNNNEALRVRGRVQLRTVHANAYLHVARYFVRTVVDGMRVCGKRASWPALSRCNCGHCRAHGNKVGTRQRVRYLRAQSLFCKREGEFPKFEYASEGRLHLRLRLHFAGLMQSHEGPHSSDHLIDTSVYTRSDQGFDDIKGAYSLFDK